MSEELFSGWDKPINLGGIETNEVMPAGEYIFTITKATIKNDKDGNPRIIFNLKDNKGHNGIDSITSKTLWKFKSLCLAAGFAKDAKVLYPSLQGKRVKTTVTIWKGDNGDRNNYKYHL